jgi:hypothetical protein
VPRFEQLQPLHRGELGNTRFLDLPKFDLQVFFARESLLSAMPKIESLDELVGLAVELGAAGNMYQEGNDVSRGQ